MSFYEFIIQYNRAQTTIADLANDVREDYDFPKSVDSWPELRGYLTRRGACEGAMRAGKNAFKAYRKQLNRI